MAVAMFLSVARLAEQQKYMRRPLREVPILRDQNLVGVRYIHIYIYNMHVVAILYIYIRYILASVYVVAI